MTRLLRKGDHIRLKVRTISGWKGEAIVVEDQLSVDDRSVTFRRLDSDPEMPPGLAMRHEVALIRRPSN